MRIQLATSDALKSIDGLVKEYSILGHLEVGPDNGVYFVVDRLDRRSL